MPEAPDRPGRWQTATVIAIHAETATAKTFRLAPEPALAAPGRPALRRPADRARRLHRLPVLLGRLGARRIPAISSSPSSGSRAARSPSFLHDEVVPGDELEVRGPIGGWFVWRGDTPALLDRGRVRASCPLMAMLRLARRSAPRPGPPGRLGAPARRPSTPTSCPDPRRRSSTPAPAPPLGAPSGPLDRSRPLRLGSSATTYVCGLPRLPTPSPTCR